MTDLLPCPFCGGPIDDMGEADSDGYFARATNGSMAVECPHCEAVGPFSSGRVPAIEAWNIRAPARVKLLSWREIDPNNCYVGTGLGFTCEVRRLHKGGWELTSPLHQAGPPRREFPEKVVAQRTAQVTYEEMVQAQLEAG